MKIALAQIGSVPGDFSRTVDHMLEYVYQAERRGADLVVFPATLFCGAYPQALSDSSAFMLDMLEAIETFSQNTPLLCAVPAYVNDGFMSYTEVFMCKEGVTCPVRQRLARRFRGDDILPAQVDATWNVEGIEICFVMGDSEYIAQNNVSDVSLFVTPVSYCYDDPMTLGVTGFARNPLVAMASESQGWLGVIQGVGAYDDMIIAGGSFVIDPRGVVACSCSLFEEDLAFFDVVSGEQEPPVVDRRPGTFVGMSADLIPELSPYEEVGYLYEALVVSVRDYVRKSGFSDVIVGLSGGIDSAVVAALASDALGCEHVLGVLMPGPYSSEGSVSDALELAHQLGIKTITVPITNMHDVVSSAICDASKEQVLDLADQNLQARLRGTILMTLSNMHNSLVLNTSNKSEAAMGYSTLYGDTVGAYSPMCDIYKHTVYDLANWRNANRGTSPIPLSTLTKAPSAELSSDQTDEASLGYSYQVIDAILDMHIERGMCAQEIAQTGMDPKAVEFVLNTCKSNEYKRRQEPMGPVVSSMPLIDRDWPVVLAWKDRVRKTDPADDQVFDWFNEYLGIDADEDFLDEFEANPVAIVLDSMIARSSNQDQIIGTMSDISFSTQITGQGPQMDGFMGFPLFSNN